MFYIVFHIPGNFFILLFLCIFVYLLNIEVPNEFHTADTAMLSHVWAFSLWDAGCFGGVCICIAWWLHLRLRSYEEEMAPRGLG